MRNSFKQTTIIIYIKVTMVIVMFTILGSCFSDKTLTTTATILPQESTPTATTVEAGINKVIGTLEAYGNHPNVVWMIRSKDGLLYYPVAQYQSALSDLVAGLYQWEGEILPPIRGLEGLIPKHEGAITSLTWKALED